MKFFSVVFAELVITSYGLQSVTTHRKFKKNDTVVFCNFDGNSPLRFFNGVETWVYGHYDNLELAQKRAVSQTTQNFINEYYSQQSSLYNNNDFEEYFPQTKTKGSKRWWVQTAHGSIVHVHESNLRFPHEKDPSAVLSPKKKSRRKKKYPVDKRPNYPFWKKDELFNPHHMSKCESSSSLATHCFKLTLANESPKGSIVLADPLKFGGNHVNAETSSPWEQIRQKKYKLPSPRRDANKHFTNTGWSNPNHKESMHPTRRVSPIYKCRIMSTPGVTLAQKTDQDSIPSDGASHTSSIRRTIQREIDNLFGESQSEVEPLFKYFQ